MIGGASGFQASMQMVLDTSAGTVIVDLFHPGGWSPVPGVIGTYLTSPQFDGTVQLGVNGICASLAAHAEWTDDIVVQDDNALEFIVLSAHPTSSAPGATMDIDVQVAECTDSNSVSFRVAFAASLQLGPDSVGLPSLALEGELASEGCSQLHAMTSDEWVPLEDVLPMLAVPQIFGNLSFCNCLLYTSPSPRD